MLTYVTRTAIPSRAAQSGQIIAMSKAFHRVMNGKFCLVSGRGDSENPTQFDFRWEPQQAPPSPLRRYVQFCATALQRAHMERNGVVFTRDIAIAFAVVGAGGRAVFEAHKEPIGRPARAMMRWLSRCSRFRLVAISQALGDYYVDRHRFQPDRVLVAHDGVFLEDYSALRQADKRGLRADLGLPLDRFLVAHTGSLARGGAELFEHLLRAGKEDIFLLHIGGSESECAQWTAYYRGRGFGNIRFLPHRSIEQARLHQVAADMLFYVLTRSWPTHWCASPLKLFEYMASGVPIFGASVGSITELINECNAFCFDPDQPETIAGAWHRFRADPAGAQRRAAQARQEAETLYSWYRRAERIVQFAHDAIEPP